MRILNKHFVFYLILICYLFCYCSKSEESVNNYPFAKDVLNKNDSTSLHVFILNDWGFNGNNNQRDVATAMALTARIVKLNLIVTCGDNFQVNPVKSVEDSLWYYNYESIYNDSSLRVKWYPALGNHDYLGNPNDEIEYSKKSKYWNMPSRYYSFTKTTKSNSSVRFIILDTQNLINTYNQLKDTTKYDTIAQYCWLKQVLTKCNEKWIIVVGHHPIFSASDIQGDVKEIKKMIKPLLDQYNVDFYICGHDHDFEHAKDKTYATDYIVSGTGGWVRQISPNSRTICHLYSLGFTYLSISQDSIKLYFITQETKIGYYYKKTNNRN